MAPVNPGDIVPEIETEEGWAGLDGDSFGNTIPKLEPTTCATPGDNDQVVVKPTKVKQRGPFLKSVARRFLLN